MSHPYAHWVEVSLGSKLQFGDAVTLSDSNETGLVIGFMGKKRDQVVVRFTNGDSHQTRTTAVSAIAQICRKPN